MTESVNNGADTRFKPGNKGRPKGSRNKRTLIAEKMFADESEAIIRKCIELAKAGDGIALRLAVERICPARRGALVTFELPPVNTAADIDLALGAVLKAVSAGKLTVDEAATLTRALRDKSENLRITQLEEAIRRIEGNRGNVIRSAA